jgi:hypothetical protein
MSSPRLTSLFQASSLIQNYSQPEASVSTWAPFWLHTLKFHLVRIFLISDADTVTGILLRNIQQLLFKFCYLTMLSGSKIFSIDDRINDYGAVGGMRIDGKPMYLEKTCPSATLSTINPLDLT